MSFLQTKLDSKLVWSGFKCCDEELMRQAVAEHRISSDWEAYIQELQKEAEKKCFSYEEGFGFPGKKENTAEQNQNREDTQRKQNEHME